MDDKALEAAYAAWLKTCLAAHSAKASLRAAIAAYEAAREPVAWQHRTRTYNDDWGPWKEGRRPTFQHPDHVIEERPLYTAAPLPSTRTATDGQTP